MHSFLILLSLKQPKYSLQLLYSCDEPCPMVRWIHEFFHSTLRPQKVSYLIDRLAASLSTRISPKTSEVGGSRSVSFSVGGQKRAVSSKLTRLSAWRQQQYWSKVVCCDPSGEWCQSCSRGSRPCLADDLKVREVELCQERSGSDFLVFRCCDPKTVCRWLENG